jgi:hypothetical protein
MPVPEMLILRAWEKSGGRCECRRWSHSHPYERCTRLLIYERRGEAGEGGWAPRFRTSPSNETALDCEILCLECHQKALASEMQP